MNDINPKEWFQPMPDDQEGFLVSSKGVLLLAFQRFAADPNKKTTVFVNKAMSLAKQRGFNGAESLKTSLVNPDIKPKDIVNHVVEIYPYLGFKTVQAILSGEV